MGMCMDQMDADFRIDKSQRRAALRAVQALHGSETVTYDSGPPHFRWVDHDFYEAKSLPAILNAWGWATTSDAYNGDIVDIVFERSKIGDEDILFTALAPHVVAGSYIEVECEGACGHDRWQWVFDGKTCQRDYDFE